MPADGKYISVLTITEGEKMESSLGQKGKTASSLNGFQIKLQLKVNVSITLMQNVDAPYKASELLGTI